MWELAGFLVPPLIDIINRKIGDSSIRFYASVAVCAGIASIVYYMVNHSLSPAEDLARSILTFFGTAQITYKAIYEDSNLQDRIRE